MDQRAQVQLPGGTVIGLRKHGIFHARGIKYAEAARFEPPKMVERWDSPIDATQPAVVCVQRPSRLAFVMGDIIKGRPMSEDCLTVTVTAPESILEQPSAKLPVMVFLHGGAYLSGGGDLDCYYPGSLASRNIVVVNVTHRVGIFGYYPIEDTAPANLGLLDQIEAMRWVQKNISYFGGDPERVTAVGQSAGATTIYCMIVADGVERLFQRAILQSTPFGWPDVPLDMSDQVAHKTKSYFQSDSRTAPASEALEVQLRVLMEAGRLMAWPRFGQYPLPDVAEAKRRMREKAADYKFLVGWTLDESVAFANHQPWSSIPLIGPYLKSLITWWDTRTAFIWPSQQFHKDIVKAGGSSMTYCFRWRPQGSPLLAVHCLELTWLLGSWDAWKDAPFVHGVGSQEVIERAGKEMKDFWAAFVAGSPSAETLTSGHIDIDQEFSFQALSRNMHYHQE